MNSLLIVAGILLYLCVCCVGKRNWNFEILHASGSSSDENLANVSVRADRETFGVGTISAVIDWKFDTDENTMAQLNMYTCQSGREEDYHEIPYKIPNITYYEFLNQYYMKVFYPDFGPCSNLPSFDGPFVPPWNKTTYIFTNCQPSADSYPEILAIGYYKLLFKIIGQAEIGIIVILKLTPKLI